MPDVRFFETATALAFDAALAIAGATAARTGAEAIGRVAGTEEGDLSGAAIFIDEKAHLSAFDGRKAGMILTTSSFAAEVSGESPIAIMTAPRLGFARLAAALHRERDFNDRPAAKADIDPTAKVHPSAVIATGVVIGPAVEVGPFAAIGPGVMIGARTRIGPAASVVCALIGADVLIKAGARLGQAGFGFVPGPEGLVKAPQLGRVIVEDGAEIGANACVDRGALGDTVVEAGAKIDNLVQVAHNVRLGASSLLAAQAGVSGSTTIGKGAMLGGKAGLADHLTIGDGAQIAAAAGVMHDIPAGERWGGIPARPMRQWFRETATLARLALRGKAKDGD